MFSLVIILLTFVINSTEGVNAEKCYVPVVCGENGNSLTSWRQFTPQTCSAKNEGSKSGNVKRSETGTSVLEVIEKKFNEIQEKMQAKIDVLNNTLKYVAKELCYMGMKSWVIPDDKVTASEFYETYFEAHAARLDYNHRYAISIGSWAAKNGSVGQWIQVDFGENKSVAGVITQGLSMMRYKFHWWITSYKIHYGTKVDEMTILQESGADKVFTANTDNEGKVLNMFTDVISCRFIRLYPQTWNENVGLRMEFVKGECMPLYPPDRSLLD